MINYFKEKELGMLLVILVVTAVIGFSIYFILGNYNRHIQKDIFSQIGNLKKYLKDEKTVPSLDRTKELQNYKNFLQEQIQQINEKLQKQGDFKNAYDDITTPLELKDLMAKIKKEFNRTSIGFEDFEKNVPDVLQVPVLKKQIAFIEKILKLAYKNNLFQVGDIVRLKSEKFEQEQMQSYTEYPCLFSFSGTIEELMPFLYDIGTAKELMIVKGIKIDSKEDGQMTMILKLSYVEME